MVKHRPVRFRQEKDQLVLDLNLGPGEGKMLMVTPVEIKAVAITVPKKATRGDRKSIAVEVVDIEGKPVDAVIPLEIRIEDPEGRVVEGSGYWATEHGKANVIIDIAPNDTEGVWKASARELASGRSQSSYFRVGKKPDPANPGKLEKGAGNAVQPKG